MLIFKSECKKTAVLFKSCLFYADFIIIQFKKTFYCPKK